MLSFFRKNTIADGELAKISRQYTNKNEEIPVGEDASSLLELGYSSPDELKETIYGEMFCFAAIDLGIIHILFSLTQTTYGRSGTQRSQQL